ncbi:MAG: cobalt-precorrin 5A hydrolase [Methanobacterium sp.]|nr:cobalt-precorrin 5A hydrolase [Methanobacterium sp.]
MRIAIISVTSAGQRLAHELSLTLEMDPSITQVDLFHKNVKSTLNDIFSIYDCILGIMATGIMVRNVCQHIKNKIEDPAILVMDEKSKHIISLLSGHHGGANNLTLKLADITGSDPVITTATDVNNKMGIDSLAYKYYMDIEIPSVILNINKALVEGFKVKLAVPPRYEYLFQDELLKNSYDKYSSNRIQVFFNEHQSFLTPKKLVVGVGSRKGVTTDSVLSAINEVSHHLGIPPERIDCMATADIKRDETGILEAAKVLSLPLKFVSLDDLKKFEHPHISESSFVRRKFGVPGICEPVSLLVAGGNSKLIYRKKAFNKVTVAMAVS